jgi:hypothetical protein
MCQIHRLSYPILVLGLLLFSLEGCGETGLGTSPSQIQRLQDSFSILRTPPETLRGSERARILRTIAFRPQAITGEQQLAGTSHGRLWIFTTSRHLLCVVQERGGGCAAIKLALKQGVYLGVFRPPTKRRPVLHDFLVQGVVPDGVRQVMVLVGAKRPRTRVVPVKDNVFSAGAEQPVHVKRLLR